MCIVKELLVHAAVGTLVLQHRPLHVHHVLRVLLAVERVRRAAQRGLLGRVAARTGADVAVGRVVTRFATLFFEFDQRAAGHWSVDVAGHPRLHLHRVRYLVLQARAERLRHVAEFPAHGRVGREAVWPLLPPVGVAAEVVPAEACVREVLMCDCVLVRELGRPLHALNARRRLRYAPAVVGAVRLVVALARTVRAVRAVVIALLVVALLVALAIVDPAGHAARVADFLRLRHCTVVSVPLALLNEALLVAHSVADPRARAPRARAPITCAA
mmetsp:Transcript_21196/g.54655  ORF Transcript_21196/g.54655 Transcript_21196/m.54655 type:complete len:272 (+) Transcript_21196:466-1281(+)